MTPSFIAMSIGIVTAGMLVYHVRFTGNALSIFAGFVFGSLSFFGMGFILASSMPTPRTAQVVGMVLLYPMLILSGAGRANCGSAKPGAARHGCMVLRVMFVVGAFASVKLFRWE